MLEILQSYLEKMFSQQHVFKRLYGRIKKQTSVADINCAIHINVDSL